MSAALHPATVFFLYLLPVAVLLRLVRKCADSVSGKAFFFFFFEIHGYSSGSPGRQATVGAEERLPSRLCTRPAGRRVIRLCDKNALTHSNVVTRTSDEGIRLVFGRM